jgi:hypothetical protein
MPHTFLHDVDVNINLHGDYADINLIATIEFTCTPFIAATYDDPAEGGEVEVVEVVEVFVPGKTTADRVTLECPKWLSDWIMANVDSDVLANSVGANAFDEDWEGGK